jgi:hypothetical protein
MFIGFEHMSNDCKVEKVNYEFGITSFFEMIMPWWSKMQFSQVVLVYQHSLTAAWLMFKNS